MPTTLRGAQVVLRPTDPSDVPVLAAIRAKPEVYARWRGGEDLVAAVREDLAEPGAEHLSIEYGGAVIGMIQWAAEAEPDYRPPSIDIYLAPAVHGRGWAPTPYAPWPAI